MSRGFYGWSSARDKLVPSPMVGTDWGANGVPVLVICLPSGVDRNLQVINLSEELNRIEIEMICSRYRVDCFYEKIFGSK